MDLQIINRITEKDIEKAKFVIFAHDVAIKEPERFRKIQVLTIRLARHGAKKRPFYQIVVADSRSQETSP